LNFYINPGFQFNVKVADNTELTLKPQFILPIFSANYASQRHHLYAAALEVGLLFRLVPDKRQSE
jgi:hypothetical protein